MAGNLQLPETSKRPIPDTNYCLIHGKTKQGNQETNILKRQNNRSVLVKKNGLFLNQHNSFPRNRANQGCREQITRQHFLLAEKRTSSSRSSAPHGVSRLTLARTSVSRP
jgi:hypothetical protein